MQECDKPTVSLKHRQGGVCGSSAITMTRRAFSELLSLSLGKGNGTECERGGREQSGGAGMCGSTNEGARQHKWLKLLARDGGQGHPSRCPSLNMQKSHL